jgi:hypothetical protein
MYEIVYDAVRAALRAENGGGDPRLLRRFEGGRVLFEDNQGKQAKEVPAEAVFRKVTSVREKLRVLEQKLNNHPLLDNADKAEMQALISRCYGSLTTFNFLFADLDDQFKGTGG